MHPLPTPLTYVRPTQWADIRRWRRHYLAGGCSRLEYHNAIFKTLKFELEAWLRDHLDPEMVAEFGALAARDIARNKLLQHRRRLFHPHVA